MLYFLIIAGILLELIVLVGGVYITLRYLKKDPITADKIEVKVVGKSITADVIRDGVKNAIREIAQEDEQERLFDKKKKTAEQVYSSMPKDTPVRNSGGNLVPYGLSDSEKAILEMFYKD